MKRYATSVGKIALAAVFFAIIALSPASQASYAPGQLMNPPWTAQERVNAVQESAPRFSPPAVAGDSAGNTYIVWLGPHNDYMTLAVKFRLHQASGGWESEQEIATAPYDLWSPFPEVDIAVDSVGRAYALWNDTRNDEGDVFISYRSLAGTWSSPQLISDGPWEAQCEPAIAVDDGGNLYAVWVDYRYGDSYDEEGGEIYFSYRPAGGSWTASVRVNDDPIGSGDHRSPEIAVDGTGNAHAIWIDRGTDTDIYSSYRPAGGNWETNQPVNDSPDSASYRTCDLAVDGAGDAYAVWADTRGSVYFSYRPSGGSWQTNEKVNDTAPGNWPWPSIAADDTGNAYIVWNPYHYESNIYARYRTATGTWLNEEMVNDGPSAFEQALPCVATDSAGNAYAVWHEWQSTPGEGNVFFSSRSRPVLPDLSLSTKKVSDKFPTPGERVTYTLSLVNVGSTSLFTLTDQIPLSTTYVIGSAYSAYGQIVDTDGITWTGTIAANTTVTAVFAVTVSAAISEPMTIVNEATIEYEPLQVLEIAAALLINGNSIYLPITLRGP